MHDVTHSFWLTASVCILCKLLTMIFIFLFSFPLHFLFLLLLSCVRTQKCPNFSCTVYPCVLCAFRNMSYLSMFLLHRLSLSMLLVFLYTCCSKFVNLFNHVTLSKCVFTINIVVSIHHCVCTCLL